MKKTLLIAAAALVAGIVTSEAQVYSANVVGYVNNTTPGGEYVLVANPLTTGNDVLTNVLTGLPGSSVVQIWTGTGFSQFTYSSRTGHWTGTSGNGDNTPVPPGVGFFLQTSSNNTNTYVGSVVAAAGASVTNALAAGVYTPVGSIIPYADTVTNTSTVNLVVGGSSLVQIWNPGTSTFSQYTYSSRTGNWSPSNPVLSVGEGFFIQPSATGNTNWVQTLP